MTNDHLRRLGLLRRFEPLRGIAWEDLSSLARAAREVRVPAGRTLVRPPRRLSGWWYLIDGTLVDEDTGDRIAAGTAIARRRVYPGVRALSVQRTATLLVIDAASGQLHLSAPRRDDGLAVTRGPAAGASGGRRPDWLCELAASPLLRALYRHSGGGAWQAWVAGLRRGLARPGATVFDAGDPADAFFVVRRGSVRVAAQQGEVVIGPGGFFGEDGLIAGQPRNARVSAPRGAELLRGGAEEMLALLDCAFRELARSLAQEPTRRPAAIELGRCQTTVQLRAAIQALPRGRPVRMRSPFARAGLDDLAMLVLFHRGYSIQLQPSEVTTVAPP
ncbi:MAG: cyclic nucleotide-binding domain-containing protein [Pseudomonadota bacterium]